MKEFVKNKMSLALKIVLAVALVGTMSATAAFAFTFHGVEIQEQGEQGYAENELYEILKHFHPDWENKPADYYKPKEMQQVKDKAGFYSVVRPSNNFTVEWNNGGRDSRLKQIKDGTYSVKLAELGDEQTELDISSGLPTFRYSTRYFVSEDEKGNSKVRGYYFKTTINSIHIECRKIKDREDALNTMEERALLDSSKVPIKEGFKKEQKEFNIIESGRNLTVHDGQGTEDTDNLYSLCMEANVTVSAFYADTDKRVKEGLLFQITDIDRQAARREVVIKEADGKPYKGSTLHFYNDAKDAYRAWQDYQESVWFSNASNIYTYDAQAKSDGSYDYAKSPLGIKEHGNKPELSRYKNSSRLPNEIVNGKRLFYSREISYEDSEKASLDASCPGFTKGRDEALGVSAVFNGSLNFTWRGSNCSTGFAGGSKDGSSYDPPTEPANVTDYKDILVGVETDGNSGNQTLTLHPHESADASVKTYTKEEASSRKLNAGDQLAMTKAYQNLLKQCRDATNNDEDKGKVKTALQDLYKSRSFAGAFTGEFDDYNVFKINPRIMRIGRTGTVQVRHSDGTRDDKGTDYEYFLVSSKKEQLSANDIAAPDFIKKYDKTHYHEYKSYIDFDVKTPTDAEPDRYCPIMLSTGRPATVEDLEADYQNNIKPLNGVNKTGKNVASYLPRAQSKIKDDRTFSKNISTDKIIGAPDKYFASNNRSVNITVDNMQGVNDAATSLSSLDVNNHTLFKVTFNNGSYGIPESGVEMLSREDFEEYEKGKMPVLDNAYANGIRVCRKEDSYTPLFGLKHLGMRVDIKEYETPSGSEVVPLYDDLKNNKNIKFAYKKAQTGVCSLSLFDNTGVISTSEVVMGENSYKDQYNACANKDFKNNLSRSGENLFSARFIYVGDYILWHKPIGNTDESRAFAGSWAVAYEKGVPYEKGWEFSGVINSYEKEHLDVGGDDWKYFDTLPDYNPPKNDPLLVRVDKRLTRGNDTEVTKGVSGTWNDVDGSRTTSTIVSLDANNDDISKRARGKYVGMKAITVEQPILIGRFDVRTISGSLPDVM